LAFGVTATLANPLGDATSASVSGFAPTLAGGHDQMRLANRRIVELELRNDLVRCSHTAFESHLDLQEV
jgi:hypothetical protein